MGSLLQKASRDPDILGTFVATIQAYMNKEQGTSIETLEDNSQTNLLKTDKCTWVRLLSSCLEPSLRDSF